MSAVLREFRLPDLGEGLTESEIVVWRIAPGDRVTLNQVIADVETAKAIVELPSPVDGFAKMLHAEPGDTVEVGATIVTFEVDEDATAAADRAPSRERPATRSDRQSGSTEEPHEGEAEAAEPNLVGYGARQERLGRPARRARREPAAPPPRHGRTERPRSSPPVRRLADQLGVQIAAIAGSGPDGRVIREDVLSAGAHPIPAQRAGQPDGALEHRIPIRGIRKHTAAAMVESAFTAPQATVFLTIDVTPTMELLQRLREGRGFSGERIRLLAVVARALCVALRAHPELNSRWDEGAQEIVQLRAVHLGIAAATTRGLIVPNIRDAHAKTLPALGDALTALVDEAREGRTPAERLRDGTITISNVGVFGVDAGTPILNPGEAAILAVGAVRSRPWEHRGELALRRTVTLSLSFDHRVVDGEQASRFLADVGELLGDPALALVRDGDTGPLPIEAARVGSRASRAGAP